jgi:hypothetical protein
MEYEHDRARILLGFGLCDFEWVAFPDDMAACNMRLWFFLLCTFDAIFWAGHRQVGRYGRADMRGLDVLIASRLHNHETFMDGWMAG